MIHMGTAIYSRAQCRRGLQRLAALQLGAGGDPQSELTRRVRVGGEAWSSGTGHRDYRPARDRPAQPLRPTGALHLHRRARRAVQPRQRGTRWAINADANGGPTVLSSFFKPVNETETIQFVDGHGWGHGVGLCQWCAQSWASRGVRHEDILRASYPGSVLVRAY